MAFRDRSQGFAFVYVDIAKLLKERNLIQDGDGPIYGEQEKSANFNRDPRPAGVSPEANQEPQWAQRNTAISQIRSNLDRLQSLHHKLHAMLEDLGQVTDADKKKKK